MLPNLSGKLQFIILGTLVFLIIILIGFNFALDRFGAFWRKGKFPFQIKKELTECQGSFRRSPDEERKTLKCGLLESRERHFEFLARFKNISIDKDNLLRVAVELYHPRDKLQTYALVLGKYQESYTWIGLQKEGELFHKSGNYQFFEENLESNLLEKLQKFKGRLCLFQVLKGNEEILNKDLGQIESKYQKDLTFRENYFRTCNSVLNSFSDLGDLEKQCGFVFAHSLVFFQDELKL